MEARPSGFVDISSSAAFQRVLISGGARHTGESQEACALLARCLQLRSLYCFKKPVYYWGSLKTRDYPLSPKPLHYDGLTTDALSHFASSTDASSGSGTLYPSGHPMLFREETVDSDLSGATRHRRPEPHWDPLSLAINEARSNLFCTMIGGVMHVFDAEAMSCEDTPMPTSHGTPHPAKAMFQLLTWEAFSHDYLELTRILHLAFMNSFAYRRLELLEARFQLHSKLNIDNETHESKV